MADTEWFAVRLLEPGVHLIAEPVHVNSYLVQGNQRAILIDTGLGIGNIREVVAGLTDLDVMVVNTHYHFDHTGGNPQFSEIAIHKEGVSPLREQVPAEVFERYAKYTLDLLERFELYRELDDRFFHFLAAETTPRPFPNDFDPKTWSVVPTVPTRLLADGDVLDLGGRRLRVLHTPGHTPDCICLLDEEHGVMFGGDTINTGPIYAQFPDSDLKSFAESTRRLAEAAGDVRVVYVAHFTRYAADPSLLGEIAEAFEALLAGEARLQKTADCLGSPVKEARFARFSVFLADTDARESTPLLGRAEARET